MSHREHDSLKSLIRGGWLVDFTGHILLPLVCFLGHSAHSHAAFPRSFCTAQVTEGQLYRLEAGQGTGQVAASGCFLSFVSPSNTFFPSKMLGIKIVLVGCILQALS